MNKARRKAIEVIEFFEEFLNEKNITIPSSDREGNDNEARIYGSEYYELEDSLTEWFVKDNPELNEEE